MGEPITSVVIPKQPYNITPLDYYAKLISGASLMVLSAVEIVADGEIDCADALIDTIAKRVKEEIRERINNERH